MTIPIGQLTPDAINLSAGDYYVKVMDINGCTITGGITLMQPVALDATITSQTNILCYGNSTGSVRLLRLLPEQALLLTCIATMEVLTGRQAEHSTLLQQQHT